MFSNADGNIIVDALRQFSIIPVFSLVPKTILSIFLPTSQVVAVPCFRKRHTGSSLEIDVDTAQNPLSSFTC